VSGASRTFFPAPPALPAPLFACGGAAFIVAASGVAAWNAIDQVAHGWWLVSFLALVGGLAQLLLGAGDRRLRAQAPARPARRSSAHLFVVWNIGTLLVPLGVLAEARAAVVVGGVALLAALSGLSLVRPGPLFTGRLSGAHAAYLALITFLAASVLIGTGLAWDLPWV
jgi:hypothetical protein